MAQPIRILLIDPDEQVGAKCVPALTRQGWLVHHVHHFAEALELAANARYDIAIIELRLPDMLGTDAWSYLVTLQPEMFGIMTTSSPSLHYSVNTRMPGVVAYLLKPLDNDKLCMLITTSLQTRSTVREHRRVRSSVGPNAP